MLHIRFGEPSAHTLYRVDGYFNINFEREWFDHPMVREMILDVDKSTVVTGSVIDSPVLGPISPRELSGSVKSLILMLFEPQYEFWGNAFGDNCAPWVLKISRMHDLHIATTRVIEFQSPEEADVGGLNAFCVNTGKPVDTMLDLLYAYGDCARRGDIWL